MYIVTPQPANVEASPTSQPERETSHQRTNSDHAPASRYQIQIPAQGDSRTLGSQDAASWEPYGGYQQTIPGNAFAAFGSAYPTSLIAWRDGSDDVGVNVERESRSRRFGDYGDAALGGQCRETAKTGRRVRRPSPESLTQENDDNFPALVDTGRQTQGKTEGIHSASCERSVESDDEHMTVHGSPLRRIPGHGDVGGKSERPSWLSSLKEEGLGHEEYRRTAVPLSIGGRIHYANYEDLISNGRPDSLPQSQASQSTSAPLAQNEADVPQPAPSVKVRMPMCEERILGKGDNPRQAHRKRARDLLDDEEAAAAHAPPPLKRQHREQSVLPLPVSTAHRIPINTPPKFVPAPIHHPQVKHISRDPLHTHRKPSKKRQQQQLDAEWAQVFNQTFVHLGFHTVNYSEVPPWNEEEVQSLINALLPTREVYFAWTGEPAPKTDPHQGYREQFDTIFLAFQQWWRAHRWDEPLPILAGVMHWGRAVDDWEPPSKDSIYYEAFRKGRTALRGENGRFLDLPGPELEDIFRMRNAGDG